VTGVEVISENSVPEFRKKCCFEVEDQGGNILRTEGEKFSMMIDTPVAICFVILQNQNQKN